MPRKQLVKIGPAAAAVNRSASTLRRWEAEGRLTPDRDEAGQRLYDLADVRAAAAGEWPAARAAAPARRGGDEVRAALAALAWDDDEEADEDEAPRPLPAPRAPVDEATRRVRAARADVEEARARRELAALQAEAERERAAAERAQREAYARAEAERAERARLDGLRAVARRYAAEQRAPADVAADVAAWITPARFPADVPDAEAAAQVRARVDRKLAPVREAQAQARAEAERERERAARRATVAQLIAKGEQWAMLQLIGWHRDDRAAALADVREALAAEVRADWTEADVVAFVGEVLDEWE